MDVHGSMDRPLAINAAHGLFENLEKPQNLETLEKPAVHGKSRKLGKKTHVCLSCDLKNMFIVCLKASYYYSASI